MNRTVQLDEQYGMIRSRRGFVPACRGELEIIVRDKYGRLVQQINDHNIVKIFAKEILAHRLVSPEIWDPNASSGTGAWVSSGIDPLNDFSVKYILFGASFAADGTPMAGTDGRYYTKDAATGSFVPITLGAGANYDGGLINAIPIAEPNRALKRIERIYFEPSYQPAGVPMLQEDVRAMNNAIVLETTLRKDEYNGFGLTGSDYFTITEVALAAGKKITTTGACEATPEQLFLEGRANGTAINVNATGTATITIDPSDISYVDLIKEGDQIKLTDIGDTASGTDSLDMLNKHYLVVSKSVGGSDIVLDRVPTDNDNVPVTGPVGVFKNTLRLFSHRLLATPFKKNSDFEITVRWRLILS